MFKKVLGLAVMFAVSTILGAVGSVSAATCNAKDELMIGDHQPLSGASAASGTANHRGVKLAIKHYNEGKHPFNPEPCLNVAGKKYKLVETVYDNKYTGEGGLAACKKLVFNDGARFLVGTMGSGPSITCADVVTEPNKVIFFTTGWSRKVVHAGRNYTYRLIPTGREFGEAFWAWANENLPGVKKVAWSGRNDDAGRGSFDFTRDTIRKYGYEVPDEPEWLDVGKTDFYPEMTRLISQNPDIINILNNPVEEGLQIKQLRELGWDGPIRAICQMPKEIMDTAGGKANMEGVYCLYGMDFDQGPPHITPEMIRIRKAYQAEFGGEDLQLQPMQVYAATSGLLEAIKMAGTIDSEKVNEVFKNFNWLLPTGVMSSWGGKETLGAPNQLVQPVTISQFRNGQVEVVGSIIVPVP